MSSVIVSGDTSGAITLAAPAVAGSNTLTLPATTDTLAVQSQAVRQLASTIVSAVATGTTTIPRDDTIPQNTEGDQYMTLSITPKSATSVLVIEVVFNGTNSASGTFTVALFQDTTANALAAIGQYISSAGNLYNMKLTYKMTSGTTSAITFKVRAGSDQAGTTTFNGSAGNRLYGGVFASSIVITEIGG